MFGRSDGKRIKKLEAYEMVMPLIMPKRYDALVYFKEQVPLTKIDEFLKEQRRAGNKYSHMILLYAAFVRVLKDHPKLNNFIVNGRMYKRNDILISMIVKPKMSVDSPESTAKMKFTGDENLDDIKAIIDEWTVKIKNDNNEDNQTDKVAKLLTKVPFPIFKLAVSTLKFMDKHNMLPKKIIEASPFHATSFITNVGSLGIGAIYHHIYEFGTIGTFVSIGKKKRRLVKSGDDIVEEKYIELGIVADERLCDGHYYAKAFKSLTYLFRNPELLMTRRNELDENATVNSEKQRRKKDLFASQRMSKWVDKFKLRKESKTYNSNSNKDSFKLSKIYKKNDENSEVNKYIDHNGSAENTENKNEEKS